MYTGILISAVYNLHSHDSSLSSQSGLVGGLSPLDLGFTFDWRLSSVKTIGVVVLHVELVSSYIVVVMLDGEVSTSRIVNSSYYLSLLC